MTRFEKHSIVKKYLGVPYKNMGRDLSGLDCWGLIVCIYKDYGIEVFDLENYEQEWQRRGGNIILGNYYENWKRVVQHQCGDVVLINYPKDNIVGHAGVSLGGGMFIHATRNGVLVSPVKGWKNRIYGFFRWENVKV